jgi:hypothetical protein
MTAKGSLTRSKFAGTKPTPQLKLFRHTPPYFVSIAAKIRQDTPRGHYIKKIKKKQIAKKLK